MSLTLNQNTENANKVWGMVVSSINTINAKIRECPPTDANDLTGTDVWTSLNALSKTLGGVRALSDKTESLSVLVTSVINAKQVSVDEFEKIKLVLFR